jgi:glycosyltransferase involved in cell wall biosynthesis
MKKVLIFGAMPPPIGGVTIHLQRFFEFVKQQYQDTIHLSMYDIKKSILISTSYEKKRVLSTFLDADIIHIHIDHHIKVILALISKIFRKRIIYTHHNSRIKSPFFFNAIYYLADEVILVNDKEIDTSKLNAQKIKHIPAFLPPTSFEPLDDKLLKKIQQSNFVISSNSSQYILIDNKDLYGFDLLIKAYAEIINENLIENPLLILVDPSATSKEMNLTQIKKYPQLNKENLLYLDYFIDFSTLIKASDLTIRATRSDGDSLSVRESLYFNTPIIASDVTYRPDGTILFKSGESKMLKAAIVNVYKSKAQTTKKEKKNFSEEIVSLYLKQ